LRDERLLDAPAFISNEVELSSLAYLDEHGFPAVIPRAAYAQLHWSF